jgi:predicted glutamine amidotransferase
LNDEELNKRILLLMTTLGSSVHKDGWGIVCEDGENFKCSFPSYYTIDSGKIIREVSSGNTSLMGHVRFASPQVPVNLENSHPFTNKQFQFMHNGKLDPKNEKEFTTEITTEVSVESKTKPGEFTLEKKIIKISDSKLYFNSFIETWKSNYKKGIEINTCFVDSVVKSVDKFYGKFAFLFSLSGLNKRYIVRGKTADLYISYLLESNKKNSAVLGYVINTSQELLDRCCILLSNLQQLDGKEPLIFSDPVLITEESIFEAGKFDIVKIGEVKETSAPVTSYYQTGNQQNRNFTGGGNTGINTDAVDKYSRIVFKFMLDNFLKISDIQNLFTAFYAVSLLEVDEEILKHFCKTVIPRFNSLSPKKIRSEIYKVCGGYLGGIYFIGEDKFEYPWMLNDKPTLNLLVKKLKETVKG